jgi:fibrillarin-like rRNA methylase
MVDLAEIQAVYYMVAATGVLIAAIFYILNIRISQRNQELMLKAQQQTLETRQAQMFMNIYDKVSSTEFTNAWEKVILTPWSTFEEYSKLWDDPDFNEAAILVAHTYEGVGVLVKESLLDIRLVALLICAMVRRYGERIMPVLEEGRRAMGYRRWLSEIEYLYNELIRYIGEHPELDTRFESSIHSLKKSDG